MQNLFLDNSILEESCHTKPIENDSKLSYNNSFYNFVFPGFNSIDFDCLILIFYLLKTKDKDNKFLQLSFKEFLFYLNFEFKKNACKKNYSKKELFNLFEVFFNKAAKVFFVNKNFDNKNNIELSYTPIFSKIDLNEEKSYFSLVLNECFLDIFSKIGFGYTSISIKDFFSLKRKYSKLLYLLLMRYEKTTREVLISLDDFLLYFTLKNSYDSKNNLSNLLKLIISPAIDELKNLDNFKNLSLRKIKTNKKIASLCFEF